MPTSPGFLLLRPKGKLAASEMALTAAGIKVFGVALLDTEANPQQQANFSRQLAAVPASSSVIFVSTEAARLALQAQGNQGLRPDLRYFAVGSSTAQVLADAGTAVQSPTRQDSEGLLALDGLQQVKGQSVLLVKGEGGRPLIEQTLSQRGAAVVPLCLYRRVRLAPPISSTDWQGKGIQCIMVTSGELLDAAFDSFDHRWLRQQHWIVVSERLATLARQKHITQISISNGASDDALVEAARQFMEQQTMAESAQQSSSSAAAASQPQVASSPKASSSKGNGMLWFLLLTLLLLSLAMAGGGYWGWTRLLAQQEALQSAADQLAQRLSANAAETQRIVQRQLSEDLAAFENQQSQKMQPLLSELQQMAGRVDENKQVLEQMAGRRPNDWVLAEADYLVRMAGRKLWLEHDVDTAIGMLKDASSRLQDMADPSLLPIRQLLAEDIQGLAQLGDAPVTDIALRLGSLAKRVDDLPLDIIVLPEADASAAQAELTHSVDDWWSNLKRSWHALFDIKVFHTGDTRPLLDTQQQWWIKARLRHQLEVAQHAALREQEALYQQALTEAMALLQQYFDGNQAAVAAFAQSLTELSASAIARQYPSHLLSAQALQDRVTARQEGEQP